MRIVFYFEFFWIIGNTLSIGKTGYLGDQRCDIVGQAISCDAGIPLGASSSLLPVTLVYLRVLFKSLLILFQSNSLLMASTVDGPSVGTPGISVGEAKEAPGVWLWLGPVLAVVAVWE